MTDASVLLKGRMSKRGERWRDKKYDMIESDLRKSRYYRERKNKGRNYMTKAEFRRRLMQDLGLEEE